MKPTTIVIADDHTMFSAALRKLLEPQYAVVGSVEDGHALVKIAAELKPDLVLVDVGMPLLNGLDACRELKKLLPRVKIIFLTMNPDPDIAEAALQIGASGYLLKNSQEDELLRAIHNAIHGVSYVTPKISRAIEENFIRRDPRSSNDPRHLSDRQREVLQLLAEGRPAKEIAYLLEISVRTVRFHKYRIMEDLGIKSNSELVQYAIKHAMIFVH